MRFIYSAKAATKLSPQPSRPSCSSGGLPELDPIAFGIGDPTESADSIHAEMLAIAKGESGLLQYDYFMSADERTCVVREAYVS